MKMKDNIKVFGKLKQPSEENLQQEMHTAEKRKSF